MHAEKTKMNSDLVVGVGRERLISTKSKTRDKTY
jgi:hypothetical protein